MTFPKEWLAAHPEAVDEAESDGLFALIAEHMDAAYHFDTTGSSERYMSAFLLAEKVRRLGPPPAVVTVDSEVLAEARARVLAYYAELDGFYGGEPIDDVIDNADGGHGSARLLHSDVRALAAEPAPDSEGGAQ